jgi:DNA mismatch repair protein MutL
MGRIAVLPPEVANRIAAGEVVERPFSVVKELVENALDAGAASIKVEIEDGGRALIRVTDDGCGMAPGDLGRLFTRHATSKLSALDDLDGIGTLGFRGEALASIGAVAEVEVLSRPRGAALGAAVETRFGAVSAPSPRGAGEGTSVTVRTLFANLPARRKFLRQAPAEARSIADWVGRLALARPDVRFELTHGDRTILSCPPAADARERLAALHGEDLARELIPLSGAAQGIRLAGWVSSPRLTFPNAAMQFVFLGARPIQDRSVSHAVREAFHTLIPARRAPLALLVLEPDLGEVDVNVHPAKTEVRFRRSSEVHRAVYGALHQALASWGAAQAGTWAPPASLPAHAERVAEAVGGYMAHAAAFPSHSHPHPHPAGTAPAPAVQTRLPLAAEAPRFLQVHSSYILVETGTGFAVVDQHALHERVLYEELKAKLDRRAIERQRYLIPEAVDTPPQVLASLEEIQELLTSLGFRLEPMALNRWAVSEAPAAMPTGAIKGFFQDLWAWLSAEERVERPRLREAMVRIAACRAAVRFGDALAASEVAELLRRAGTSDFSFACQHGRPTALPFTLGDLAQRFGRH